MIKLVEEYVNNMQGFLTVKETSKSGKRGKEWWIFLSVEFMQVKRWFVISIV